MVETLPCDDFLAKHLRDRDDHQLSIRTFGKAWMVTHTCNIIKIACRVYSQNLDCDLVTLIFAHPHIGVPAAVQSFF